MISIKSLFNRYAGKAGLVLLLVIWIAVLAYRPALWTVIGALGVSATVIGLIFFISGKKLFTFVTASVLLILLWLINNIKRAFWKERLFFDDFAVLTDPSNFGTVFHYPLPAILTFAVVILAVWCMVRAFRKETGKCSWMMRTAIGVPLILLGVWVSVFSVEKGQLAWMQTLSKGSNIIANVLMSAQVEYKSPALRMASNEEFPSVPKVEPTTGPLPDIVLLLQESTMDPRMFKGLDYSTLPTLEMFRSPYATEQGPLRVHTYGGGTWRSEFSALTGLSSDDFTPLAGSVFYSAVFHVQDSLFRRLKAAGYTVVVVSPFVEGAYNSGTAYRTLGADEVFHPSDFGYPCDPRKNLWKIRTADIIELVKKAMAKYDGPVAVYALTMQEHGPYPGSEVKNPKLKSLAGFGAKNEELPNLESYVQRIEDASGPVVEFDRWVQERDKPTVMVRFGDHQPAMKWNAGYVSTESQPDYLANFALVDNRSKEHKINTSMTDIVFLPGMILERLPLEMGRFFETNTQMRNLCGGHYIDCQNKALLKAYQHEIFVNQRIAE